MLIKKLILLFFLMLVASCGLQIIFTKQDTANFCARGSIQNDLEIQYNYGGAPEIHFNFAEIAQPLKVTFDNLTGVESRFKNSTFYLYITVESGGNTITLHDKTYKNTNFVNNLTFNALSSPAYVPEPGDKIQVRIESDISIRYEGQTIDFPSHTETLHYNLKNTAPSDYQYVTGEVRSTNADFACVPFLNPMLLISPVASITPGKFDVQFFSYLVTSPLEPFLDRFLKVNPSEKFKRSFSIQLKDASGALIDQKKLSFVDTDTQYAAPSGVFMEIAPGEYRIDVSIQVQADFGEGPQTASQSSTHAFKLEAGTGKVTFDNDKLKPYEWNLLEITPFD